RPRVPARDPRHLQLPGAGLLPEAGLPGHRRLRGLSDRTPAVHADEGARAMNVSTPLRWLGSLLAALAVLAAQALAQGGPDGLRKIEHIVVIYLENRSFDHLFGNFPGANGLANAGDAAIQVDGQGRPYATLPDPLDLRTSPPRRYAALPEKLPNRPFRLNDHFKLDEQLGSLVHAYYQQQAQIHGGAMNRFAAVSDAQGYAMAYWHITGLRLWDYARRYTVADSFFHAAFGGSFLNHFWLVCACTPVYPNAPDKIVARLDGAGQLVKDGRVTPDGYGVNTMEPIGGPHGHDIDPALLLPVQAMPTIGDPLRATGPAPARYSRRWDQP